MYHDSLNYSQDTQDFALQVEKSKEENHDDKDNSFKKEIKIQMQKITQNRRTEHNDNKKKTNSIIYQKEL